MYYPLSQITVNLYSNGELSYKSNDETYIGYYWKTSTEKYYTGKTPQDLPNEELIVNNNIANQAVETDSNVDLDLRFATKNNYVYSISKNVSKNTVPLPPIFYITLPTQQDYQIGEFRRYFCKKTNEISYLEISKETYDKLIGEDPQILYQLYQPFNIPWRLTGDKEQVYKTNRNIVELTIKQQKLPQFDLYLKKDYTKYHQ